MAFQNVQSFTKTICIDCFEVSVKITSFIFSEVNVACEKRFAFCV